MGRPTVSDVARRAGVSRGTVSKALNDTGQLSPETRHRVQAAAAELGFEPNPQARSLTSGRTFTVGLLTSDSIGRFSIPMLQGDGLRPFRAEQRQLPRRVGRPHDRDRAPPRVVRQPRLGNRFPLQNCPERQALSALRGHDSRNVK